MSMPRLYFPLSFLMHKKSRDTSLIDWLIDWLIDSSCPWDVFPNARITNVGMFYLPVRSILLLRCDGIGSVIHETGRHQTYDFIWQSLNSTPGIFPVIQKPEVEDVKISAVPSQTFQDVKVSLSRCSSRSSSRSPKRKYVKQQRESSPEADEQVLRVNSRGREIALPRRYLLWDRRTKGSSCPHNYLFIFSLLDSWLKESLEHYVKYSSIVARLEKWQIG